METTMNYNRSGLGGLIKLALILAFIYTLFVYTEHAYVKHGQDAELVRKCMQDQGPVQMWAKGMRVYNVCMIDAETFGIMITDGEREVTSFIKNKMHKLHQVEAYLRNIGAMKVGWP